MTYSYTFDFIRAYYAECADEKITREQAYERVEHKYYLQNKALIDRGAMKDRKFSGFDSFISALNYHLKHNKSRI